MGEEWGEALGQGLGAPALEARLQTPVSSTLFQPRLT